MVRETEARELKTESTAVRPLFKSSVKKRDTKPNPHSKRQKQRNVERKRKDLTYSTKTVVRSNVFILFLVKTLSLYPKTDSDRIVFLPDVRLTGGHRKAKREKAREIPKEIQTNKKQGEKY